MSSTEEREHTEECVESAKAYPISSEIRHDVLEQLTDGLSTLYSRKSKKIIAELSSREQRHLRRRVDAIPEHEIRVFISIIEELELWRLRPYLKYLSSDPRPSSGRGYRPRPINSCVTKRSNPMHPATSLDGSDIAILKLPPEIQAMIVENLFRAAFVPGQLFLESMLTKVGDDRFADAHMTWDRALTYRSLDPVRYERYKKLYWSENTWIVRSGPPCYTTRVLEDLMPYDSYDLINYFSLAFSTADLSGYPLELYDEQTSVLENIASFRGACTKDESELLDTWHTKFQLMDELNLDTLTLNFTEAYSPDGTFMGKEAVGNFYAFYHGLPFEVRIEAPNALLEKGIEESVLERGGSENSDVQ